MQGAKEVKKRRKEQVTLAYSNPMAQVSNVLGLLAQPTASEDEHSEE
jgi:hypothetical protein